MPRPKEYNKKQLLEAATHMFWKKGYKGTSMNDLVGVTGVHRRSLYEEFNGKDGLFLECIDTYLNETGKNLVAILQRKPQGIINIEEFFRDRVEYASSGHCQGCLVANTAVEKELVDERIMEKVLYAIELTEMEFLKCLRVSQEIGEIKKDKDCKMLAKYLLCFLQGLMVMGKTHPSKESLEKVVHAVMTTIKS
jgi:TetR/AcrR family transcriptional repressor of nem operon